MKRIGLVIIAVVTMAFAFPQAVHAAPAVVPKAADKPDKALASKPFKGKLKSIDAQNRTITLTGAKAQTFQLTAETKIFKDDRPATFADLVIGEALTGNARETADGKWEARSVYGGKHSAKKQ